MGGYCRRNLSIFGQSARDTQGNFRGAGTELAKIASISFVLPKAASKAFFRKTNN